jgi:prophage regulatory protein
MFNKQGGFNFMHNLHLLPETGFLRLPTVLTLIPVGKTTWWNGVKTGRFPKPVKLGSRVTVWRAEDIRAWIDQSGQPLASKNIPNGKGGDVSCN